MLSREEILSKTELKKEKVSVPEWGGDVFVSEMTGTARDAWEISLTEKDKKIGLANARAKLVAATVVDEAGRLLFTNPQDIEKLGNLSTTALDRICKVAQRINSLTQQDLEAAEGNS